MICYRSEIKSFIVHDEWISVCDNDGMMFYVYAGSEMTVLQLVDSTGALNERMKMDEISNAEYAGIDDII